MSSPSGYCQAIWDDANAASPESFWTHELFENVPFAAALTDLDGRLRQVNGEFARLAGLPPAVLVGRGICEALDPADHGEFESLLSLLASGQLDHMSCEHRLRALAAADTSDANVGERSRRSPCQSSLAECYGNGNEPWPFPDGPPPAGVTAACDNLAGHHAGGSPGVDALHREWGPTRPHAMTLPMPVGWQPSCAPHPVNWPRSERWVRVQARRMPNPAGESVRLLFTLENISNTLRVRQSLEALNAQLEVRVAERTAALEQINAELRAEATQRRAALAALQEAESRWRCLMASAPDLIVIADRCGRVRFANRPGGWPWQPVAGGLRNGPGTGDTPSQIPGGIDPLEGLTEASRALAREAFEAAWQTAAVTAFEAQALSSPACWVCQVGPVSDQTSPVGLVVSDLVVIVRDITDQRLAEAELDARRQRHALSDKMRALGQMSAGLAHDFNNALSAVVGLTDLLMTRGDLAGDVVESLRAIRTAGLDAGATVQRLQQFARSAQDRIANRNGHIPELNGIASRRFVGASARERPTRERPARKFRPDAATPPDENRLAKTRRAVPHDTALDSAMGSTDSFVAVPTGDVVDLSTLVTEVATLTRHRWQDATSHRTQARIDLRCRAAWEPCRVRGHPSELRDLLVNLVFNAVDALPHGGMITLSTGRSGARCFVAVSDDGMGMDETVRRRCFEPFFTTKGSQGNGLGLAVAWATARRHGGSLAVHSLPGVGSTFTLWLPAHKVCSKTHPVTPSGDGPFALVSGTAHAALENLPDTANSDNDPTALVESATTQLQARRMTHQDPPPDPARGGCRVLVVDDQAAVGQVTARLVQALGHHAVVSDSGQTALHELDRQPFDLVLTDLGMPGMDGCQLAQTVRQRWPDQAMVLMTGWSELSDEVLTPHAASLFVSVLGKPLRLETLRRILDALSAAKSA